MIRMNDDGRLFALTGERQTAETWAPGRSTPVRFVELRDGESITPPASPDDERAEWWMIRMDDGRLFALTGDKGTAERWAPDRSTPVRFVELRDGETIQAARASGTKAETREGM